MLNHRLKALAFNLFVTCSLLGISKGQLRVGFYSQTCPTAENVVQNVVQSVVSEDRQEAARLLRLFFHDCFVEGCDGSILLDGGSNVEKSAPGNAGVGGYSVIERAKAELETACPGLVSCADIVALAARDAVALTGGPNYDVPTGRRDGRISDVSRAANLPDVDDSIELLKSKFRQKGLSDQDLVLLGGGGHTIGTVACFFMPKRLYNFSGRGDSDPAINSQLLPQLKARCPMGGDVNVRLPLDVSSESTFDDHILRNIRNGFAMISSDARLNDDPDTKQILDAYVSPSSATALSFREDFARAMIKLGNVGVKTVSEGDIRRVCNAVN